MKFSRLIGLLESLPITNENMSKIIFKIETGFEFVSSLK